AAKLSATTVGAKRPLGITVVSALLLAAAVALLGLTLMHHVGGLTGVFRLVAVLVMVLIALGLWKLHNAARTFLFFLCAADVIGCLLALFLYALRQAPSQRAVFLVV